MLYRAKQDKDEGVKSCKIVGNGNIYGYKLINTYFVDNIGFGADDEIALTFNKFLNKVRAGFYYGIRDTGRFQVYIGEYKKLTKKEILEINPDIVSSKKVKNNTRLTEYKNGDKILKLHSTDIIKWQDDKIILNSGGWNTVTTRARFNEWLPDGVKVYQNTGITYLQDTRNKNIDTVEFFDGMELAR